MQGNNILTWTFRALKPICFPTSSRMAVVGNLDFWGRRFSDENKSGRARMNIPAPEEREARPPDEESSTCEFAFSWVQQTRKLWEKRRVGCVLRHHSHGLPCHSETSLMGSSDPRTDFPSPLNRACAFSFWGARLVRFSDATGLGSQCGIAEQTNGDA